MELTVEQAKFHLNHGIKSKEGLANVCGVSLDEFETYVEHNPLLKNLLSKLDIEDGTKQLKELTDTARSIINQVLTDNVLDDKIAARCLSAFGLQPVQIAQVLEKPLEWVKEPEIKAAIERGRLQGLVLASGMLFDRMKFGNMNAITSYLKAFGGQAWADNPAGGASGDALATPGQMKEIIDMAKIKRINSDTAGGA